jgi:hypothetical protein
MDQLAIKSEFHVQWRNMELADLYSLTEVERAYELLQCSGELQAEVGAGNSSHEDPSQHLGYGDLLEEDLDRLTRDLVGQHQGSVRDNTPFTRLQHKQFITLARIFLSFSTTNTPQPSPLKKRLKPPEKPKEEATPSPLTVIGVRAGLPLLFALIKRSWRRPESQMSEEVYE